MNIHKLSEIQEQSVSHDPQLLKKVMIQNGEIPHLTNFSQVVIKPDQSVTQHSHQDMYEVFFVQQGECEVTVNGEAVLISENSSFAIYPKQQHSFKNTSNQDVIMVYFGVTID